jgi:hypothetical protein
MKIKDGYLLREVAETNVVVPVGAALNFSGMITLNGTCAFLWKQLSQDTTEDRLLKALLEEYEVEAEAAKRDLSEFLARLKAADILE